MRGVIVQIGALLIIGFLSGFFVYAQLLPDTLSISASPSSPSPGETVTIQAVTAFDKNTARFDWTMDGTYRGDLSGTGKNIIQLKARGVGSTIRATLTVTPQTGDRLSKSLTVRTSDLSLTWFAETHTPKWYKGKALPIQDSVVSVVAIPQIILDGILLRPENLSYRWGLDNTEQALEGIGERVFRIRTSEIKKITHQITVVVEDSSKRIRKEGRILITPTVPYATIYATSLLGGGDFRKDLRFFAARSHGLINFLVEPFFFAISSKKELSYRWSVAGNPTEGTPANPFILTLDTAGQTRGVVPISVTIDDTKDFTPSASAFSNLFLP